MVGLHVSQGLVYQKDVGILKQYTDTIYKLVHMRTLRMSGYEEEGERGKKNTAGNTAKLSQSLSRTKAKVYELAVCNPWELFVTFTLSPDKHDRYDLNGFQKKLHIFLKNLNYRNNLDIKYLLIPEPHKDGAWHMHGFFMGLPLERLQKFTLGENLPRWIQKSIENGVDVYDWSEYRERFGWVTMTVIRDHEKVSKYITKYITKELEQSKIALNCHMYYASHGLKRAKVIFQDYVKQAFEADFENDYVRLKDYDNISDAMQPFCDQSEAEIEQ